VRRNYDETWYIARFVLVFRTASIGRIMLIEFVCPNGHKLKAPAERAGKAGKCPKCGIDFVVPAPEPEEDEPVEDFAEATEQAVIEPTAGGAAASAEGEGSSPSDTSPTAGSDAKAAPADAKPATEVKPAAKPQEQMITFLCPNGHKLNSPASLQGRAGKCPHCGEKFLVPMLDEMNETDDFGVEDEAPVDFGGEAYDEAGEFADEEFGDEIPDDALEEEEIGLPHPARRLFERLWREREHGGRVKLHLVEGGAVEADFYARNLSRGQHGVVASRDEKGNYRIMAIAWDDVRRVEVDELVNLPDGVFE
jgi:hypothetical protein